MVRLSSGSGAKRARPLPLDEGVSTPIRRRQTETATPRGGIGVTDASRSDSIDQVAITQRRLRDFVYAADDTPQQPMLRPLLLAYENAGSRALGVAAGVSPILVDGASVHDAIASSVAAAELGTENNAMLAAVGLVGSNECLSLMLQLLVEMKEIRSAVSALSAAAMHGPARVASSEPTVIDAGLDKKLFIFFTIDFLLKWSPFEVMTPADIVVLSGAELLCSLAEVRVVPRAPLKVLRSIVIHRFCFVLGAAIGHAS